MFSSIFRSVETGGGGGRAADRVVTGPCNAWEHCFIVLVIVLRSVGWVGLLKCMPWVYCATDVVVERLRIPVSLFDKVRSLI